jgi:phosphatidylglycerophosphate synthase
MLGEQLQVAAKPAVPRPESEPKRRLSEVNGEARLGFKDAFRLQQSLLAPIEKRVLLSFARHTPDGIKPDHLTIIGLSGMLMAGICYAFASKWAPAILLVNACIAINWFGDSLDGTLARFRNKQRPRYGFYVDHIVDAFGTLFAVGGLALSGYITVMIAAGVLIAFFMLQIQVFLATYTIGTFRLSFFKLSPTELRVLLAVGNVVAFYRPMVTVFGEKHLLFDVGGVVTIGIMMFLLIGSAIRNTITLFRAERV